MNHLILNALQLFNHRRRNQVHENEIRRNVRRRTMQWDINNGRIVHNEDESSGISLMGEGNEDEIMMPGNMYPTQIRVTHDIQTDRFRVNLEGMTHKNQRWINELSRIVENANDTKCYKEVVIPYLISQWSELLFGDKKKTDWYKNPDFKDVKEMNIPNEYRRLILHNFQFNDACPFELVKEQYKNYVTRTSDMYKEYRKNRRRLDVKEEIIENDETCCVCFYEDRPKIKLRCRAGHTLCVSCSLDIQKNDEWNRCPLCRDMNAIPEFNRFMTKEDRKKDVQIACHCNYCDESHFLMIDKKYIEYIEDEELNSLNRRCVCVCAINNNLDSEVIDLTTNERIEDVDLPSNATIITSGSRVTIEESETENEMYFSSDESEGDTVPDSVS